MELPESGVSIIICTYNGSSRIEACLKHVSNSKFEDNFEVIVVDNASLDDTALKANSYFDEFGIHGKVISEPVPGLSVARWRGVSESKFEFVLFCDDDNWISKDFLKIGYHLLKSCESIGVLGSNGSPVFESKKPEWFDGVAHSYAIGDLGKSDGQQPSGSYHYGACCFFRKSTLLELKSKGFNSVLSDRKGSSLTSGGDVELCYAVQLLGYELWFNSNLRFQHQIEAHRLEWAYYLNLKKGISSNFPLLESYRILDFPNYFSFHIHLIHLGWIAFKGIIFSLFLPQNNENQVLKIVIIQKFKSFFPNYKKTLRAYSSNQKVFKINAIS